MKPREYMRLPEEKVYRVSRQEVTGQSSETLSYLRVRGWRGARRD